jgi:DNA (cytosine-5)-methyltransferase 1
LGYDCEWQVFNSKYFGLPQNRERVYTIGHHRQKGCRKILPLQREYAKSELSGLKKLGNCYPSKGQNGNIYSIEGVAPTLSAGVGDKGTGIGSSNAPKIAIAVKPELVGGLGEKKSNGGTQYYFQDRVYSADSVAVSVTAAFNPWYLVKVKNETICSHIENGKK